MPLSTNAAAISRRSFVRSIGLAGAAATGAAFLGGCGSGTKSSSATKSGTGVSTSAKSASSAKYKWRTGTVVAKTDTFYTFLSNVAEAMKEKTDGAVDMQIFPNGQLGAETDTFKLQQSGSIAFQGTSTVTINSTVPSTLLYSLPYVLDPSKPDEMQAVFNGPTSDRQRADLEKIGIHVLGFVNNGTRQLGGKKAFAVPGDMKGVKIRVPGTPLYESIFTSYGAVPTPLALTDVYTALQQGLVSAYEQPLPGILSQKWYEVANQVTLISYSVTPVVLAINKGIWDGLDSTLQGQIQDAVTTTAAAFNRDLPNQEKSAQDALAKLGVSFSTPDLGPWKSGSKTVYSQFADQVGGMSLIDQVIAGKS